MAEPTQTLPNPVVRSRITGPPQPALDIESQNLIPDGRGAVRPRQVLAPRLQKAWLIFSLVSDFVGGVCGMFFHYFLVEKDIIEVFDYVTFAIQTISLLVLGSATCYTIYLTIVEFNKATKNFTKKWQAVMAHLAQNALAVLMHEIVIHAVNGQFVLHLILSLQAASFIGFLKYHSLNDDGDLVKTLALEFSRSALRFWLVKDYPSFGCFFGAASVGYIALAGGWFTGTMLTEDIPDVIEDIMDHRAA